MKLSFLGTGNMGSAIVRAICTEISPDSVYLSSRSPEKPAALADEFGCHVCASNAECARDADYIFLCVKPDVLPDVVREIAPMLRGWEVLVSMAAGISGDAIRALLQEFRKPNPIVRILPNTPCAVGKGLVLIAPCGEVPAALLTELEGLLSPCGMVAFTDEAHADIGMVIGGCTPAYAYVLIEALADGGVRCGLPRKDALRWAAQAVAGAAEYLLESGQHPGALKDAVCSPGGSTIEGIRVLERSGFRSAAMEAVCAAFDKDQRRSREAERAEQ